MDLWMDGCYYLKRITPDVLVVSKRVLGLDIKVTVMTSHRLLQIIHHLYGRTFRLTHGRYGGSRSNERGEGGTGGGNNPLLQTLDVISTHFDGQGVSPTFHGEIGGLEKSCTEVR